jgi:purine-binding chemotaxis protein CheW
MVTKYIVFKLAEQNYAIAVDEVRSIEALLPITRVPSAPHYVMGVVNLRGVVTPILNLRQRLGMDMGDTTANTRILVVSEGELTVGFSVDATRDIVDFETGDIQLPDQTDGALQFVKGISLLNQQTVTILDIEQLLDQAV